MHRLPLLNEGGCVIINLRNANQAKEYCSVKKNNNESNNNVQYMPIGMCIGLSIGLAIGSAAGNIGVGMCLGLGIGLCFGFAIDTTNHKKSENNSQADDKTTNQPDK